MTFKKIPHNKIEGFSENITSYTNFQNFINDFNLVSVKWHEPLNISSSSLLKLIQSGSSTALTKNELSNDLRKYHYDLFDHGALWKTNNGKIICTSFPYADKTQIINSFNNMLKEFNYPSNVKLKFLDNKYHYRSNGDFMILIYFD